MREPPELTQAGPLAEATAGDPARAAWRGDESARRRALADAAAAARRCWTAACSSVGAAAPRTRPTPSRPRRPGAGEFTSGSHTHAHADARLQALRAAGPVPASAAAGGDAAWLHPGPGRLRRRHRYERAGARAGLFVLYPAQSEDANPPRCWNWFKHNHQQRDSGEPALIAA